MKVTITFNVSDEQYDDYESIIDEFTNNLDEVGISEIDVHEDDDTSVLVSKTALAEIDSELFFNEISMDTKSWSYDYEDLKENKPVFEYINEYYSDELEALKNGTIDYLEVYCDY